jgi:hypothetical protein
MKFLKLFLSKTQKELFEILVERGTEANRSKDKELLRAQFRKHSQEKKNLIQSIELERTHINSLKSKLQNDRDSCREVEELYAYRILALGRMSETIKNICALSENFMILNAEVKQGLQILESSPNKQEIVDKVFKHSKLIHMPKK